jgi:hypothetical protein
VPGEPALHLRDLTGKVFSSIKAFLENLEVVENELIPLERLDDPFKGMAEKFYELLEQFRLLTYGQLISRAPALVTAAAAATSTTSADGPGPDAGADFPCPFTTLRSTVAL